MVYGKTKGDVTGVWPDNVVRCSQVAPQIKERMMVKGSLLVGYQPQGDKVNFFRLVISNVDTSQADMDFAIQEIQELGKDLWPC